jgi:ABC-type hemin transport system substrate-binding protein
VSDASDYAAKVQERVQAREKALKSARRQVLLNGLSAMVGRIGGGGLFYLIGWNFGATEIIERLGGPDAQINYGIALCAFLLVECIKSAQPGSK